MHGGRICRPLAGGASTRPEPTAASRLWALVAADFDRKICTKRKLAAWCAFWGEAKSRPTYQALCGARDVNYQELFVALCAELKAEGNYAYDAEVTALGLSALMEGLWWRLMMGDGFTREKAHGGGDRISGRGLSAAHDP